MNETANILVIGGAGEAVDILRGLCAADCPVRVRLAEAERDPQRWTVPVSTGRFAGPAEAREWLAGQDMRAVIDAGHAFEATMSLQLAQAATALGLPYLRVLRPPWTPAPGDRWRSMPSVAAAAEALPKTARGFTNTGRATVPDFAGFAGAALFMRRTEAGRAPAPYPFLEYVVGHPPFSVADETALFAQLAITHLICRNTGGTASASKLLAARALGLEVMMIDRPAAPDAPQAATAQAALDWVLGL